MILNNSINNSFVSATLGPSYPYENYPDKKKTCIKSIFWLQPQAPASMQELQK